MAERFFKYHGLGNDFVVLDRRRSNQDITLEAAVAICDRRRGVGADGVLVLLPDAQAAARMSVHNADGSVAEMCGNGLRCAAKYLVDTSGEKPEQILVETGAGPLSCRPTYKNGEVDEVEIAMGPARLVADHLPSKGGEPFVQKSLATSPGVKGTAVSMGNPHFVLFDWPERPEVLGPKLEFAEGFPERTNVEFATLRPGGVDLVVWERGCGFTQACGTGACATVAAAAVEGRLPVGQWVSVTLPGGKLEIKVEPELSQVYLRGPATFVYEGLIAA